MAWRQEDLLLRLIQGSQGKSWAFGRSGWSSRSQTPVCEWDGIICDQVNQTVVGIHLASSDLLGTIPTEVGLLSQLQQFELQHNTLSGTIPSELFALPLLEKVNLSGNRLSGAIQSFASSYLTFFDVSSNMLNGTLPIDFGINNAHLTNLDLRNNQLSGGIPTALSSMSSLLQLSLSNNTLSGTLPTFLGKLNKLKYLYLNDNNLVGTISAEWGVNGSELKEAWLEDNRISGSIPSSLSLVSSLVNFYLDGNKITGTIPSALCSSKINSDFFEKSSMSRKRDNCSSIACPVGTIGPEGVSPCTPCNMTLFNPYLGRKGGCYNHTERDVLTKLLTPIPTDNSSRMWIQVDSACNYEGVTCNQQGRVVGIDASGRGLSGTIPFELGFFPYLRALNLSNNNLTGFLPSELRFAPLESLDISGNRFRGLVPPLLCNNVINGNGVNGMFPSCDTIACPVGSYSKSGFGDCVPCENINGITYLGSKSCSNGTVTSSVDDSAKSHGMKSIAAVVCVAIIVAAVVVGIRLFLLRRLKRQKYGDMLETGQIRNHEGENNFPHEEEIKVTQPFVSNSPPFWRLPFWFGKVRLQPNDEEDGILAFRGRRSSRNKEQRFVIDDEDDTHSELERIVMKRKLEGGTDVWEYPDPLEQSVASWSVEDDGQRSYHSSDYPKELWLDVPKLRD